MVIEAYSGFSKKHNSTKQPSGSGTQINVQLKENTSVLNPVFLVHAYNFSHNYIKWGSRYYFIDDIVSISNDMAEYRCSTDVLATFKSAIGSSSQYVLRAAGAYNPYVMDTKYPALAESTLTSIFLSDLTYTSPTGLGSYVIGVISSTTSGNAVTYYSLGPGSFTQLMIALFDSSYLNASDITTELQKELVNPMQYIVSCYWYPFQLNGDAETLKFGWWDSGVTCGRLSESDRIYSSDQTFSMPAHPQSATRGLYLMDSPYTRYTLNCYSFGSIPIDPAPFVGRYAGAIQIDVDVFTGVAQLYVAAQGSRLFQVTSQIGVPIQINQNTANVIGGAISALGGAVGLAYGNVVGFAQGIASALDAAFPQVQSQGANGSKIAFMATPSIVAEFRLIADEDNAQIGRPLCAQRTISTLSGYILCEDADLDTSASPAEKNEIIGYMNGGFYYE